MIVDWWEGSVLVGMQASRARARSRVPARAARAAQASAREVRRTNARMARMRGRCLLFGARSLLKARCQGARVTFALAHTRACARNAMCASGFCERVARTPVWRVRYLCFCERDPGGRICFARGASVRAAFVLESAQACARSTKPTRALRVELAGLARWRACCQRVCARREGATRWAIVRAALGVCAEILRTTAREN